MRLPMLLLLVSTAAVADDAAFIRCRGIADAAARLACYDALPLPTSPARSTPPAAAQKPQERFGLLTLPEADAINAIESTIPGHFEGWGPNSAIRLANGQLWQIADGSSRFLDVRDPKVTIRRGAMGAFYLEFEGDNRTARVKRLR